MKTETELRLIVQQQAQQITTLTAALNDTRTVLEKLGAVVGMEFSQDAKDWVSKQKLDELRKNPRPSHA